MTRKRNRDRFSQAITFAVLAMPGAAWAQGSGPAGVLGGGNESPPVPDYSSPSNQQTFSLPDLDTLLPPASAGEVGTTALQITDINITGMTIDDMVGSVEVIKKDALQRREQSNSRWSQSDILTLRDQITRAYIAAGYVNSGAVLPDQDISDGVLDIEVVEGRLTETPVRIVTPPILNIFGDPPTSERRGNPTLAASEQKWRPLQLRQSYVTSRLSPNGANILNQIDLQKRFQNLAADPAIQKIDAALTPGNRAGEARLYLDVYETKPVWLYATAASERSPSIGGERAAIGGGVRNLVGYGDVLTFQVGVTEGLNDAVLAYNLPFGNSPFSLNAHGEYSDAEIVEEPLTNLNVLSDSTSYGLGASYKILDSVSMQCVDNNAALAQCEPSDVRSSLYDLNVSADISQKNSKSELLGIPFSFSPGAVNGETENLVASLSINGVLQSPRQVAAARIAVSYGLETLETTATNAPPENFVSMLAQTQYARRVFDDLDHQIIARLDVQYSPDTLYSSERYAFGGIDSVRGYRKNEVLSDNAAVGSLEYRIGLEPLFGGTQTRFFDDWSVSLFGDVGYGWNSELADPLNNTLASVGLQLNFDMFDRVSGSIFYGHQLEEIPSPRDEKFQDSGFGFRLTFRGL